jgi:hypothetical protein
MRAPRSTRGASGGVLKVRIGGGGRDKGATRTPASRQPKLHGPGAPAARHWGLWVAAARAMPIAPPASRGPRSGGEVSRRKPRKPEKVSPPGVVRSRLQTSRAGRRRDGGLAVSTIGRRFFEKHRPACVSREAQARGSGIDPASRAALTFLAVLFGMRRSPRARTSGWRSVG